MVESERHIENENAIPNILKDLDSYDLEVRLAAIQVGLDHPNSTIQRKAILRGLVCFDEALEEKAKSKLLDIIKTIIQTKYNIFLKLIHSFHKPQSEKELEGVFIDSVNHIFLSIYYAYGESTANIQNWEGYIYWTMRNYFTRNKNKSERSIPVPPDFILDALNENTDEEEYFDYEAYALALSDLSEEDQEIIKLRYEQGIPPKELPEIYGSTHGSRKFRLHKAKKRLTELYQYYQKPFYDYEAYKLALNKLSKEKQEIIKLRYEQGFSCDEIAKRLGIKSMTVRSRLYRIKIKLMSYYQEIISQGNQPQ